ncbi:unnamed protein product, partial [Amoebophrya sp. A25]
YKVNFRFGSVPLTLLLQQVGNSPDSPVPERPEEISCFGQNQCYPGVSIANGH